MIVKEFENESTHVASKSYTCICGQLILQGETYVRAVIAPWQQGYRDRGDEGEPIWVSDNTHKYWVTRYHPCCRNGYGCSHFPEEESYYG